MTSQTRALGDFETIPKDCSSCDVDFKREALKRLILLLLVGGRQYVAVVDLLDENEVF